MATAPVALGLTAVVELGDAELVLLAPNVPCGVAVLTPLSSSTYMTARVEALKLAVTLVTAVAWMATRSRSWLAVPLRLEPARQRVPAEAGALPKGTVV